VQFRLGQGNGPEYSFEIEKHNGILVRQSAAAEFPTDRLIEKLKPLVLADGKGDLRVERAGGHEVVVAEKDIRFADQPPVPGHSKSYAFGYGGKSWQIEFYSTDKNREAAANASLLFGETLAFKAQ
jgi:hypothetical protein